MEEDYCEMMMPINSAPMQFNENLIELCCMDEDKMFCVKNEVDFE